MATNRLAPPLLRAKQIDGPEAEQHHLPVTFDVDAFHAMQKRDEGLIAERVLEGAKGKVFVYNFKIQGSEVRGISVDGAHHLANHYGGLQHRIVASMEKRGRVFTFTSYPAPETPMAVTVSIVPDLEDEPDFYRAVVEVKDIKTGNAFQAEKAETRLEQRRDGTTYERPNYQTIAQSKARRNALLMLIPRDVQEKFEVECLKLGNVRDITEDVFTEKRRAVITFAAKNGIALDRAKVAGLGNDQITGLRQAMQESGVKGFRQALHGIGLDHTETVEHDADGLVNENGGDGRGETIDVAGEQNDERPQAEQPALKPARKPRGEQAPADDDDGMFSAGRE